MMLLAAGLLATGMLRAQQPAATYDGETLTISVPSGRLGFTRAGIRPCRPVRDAFAWNPDSTCLFMPGTYTFSIEGWAEAAETCLDCQFNGAAHTLCVKLVPKAAPQPASAELSDEPLEAEAGGGNADWQIPAMAAVIALLAATVILLALRNLHRRGKSLRSLFRKNAGENEVFTVIEDSSGHYEKGLGHVLQHQEEYLTFNLQEVSADTAIKHFYFSIELVKKVYSFFNRSLENGDQTKETGCYLIGCWDYAADDPSCYDISVEYMVEPGDDADLGEYSLNFGKKIGVSMGSLISSLSSKTGRDYVLTCWIHSHPGLGLFLSNQDLIVQQKLAYAEFRNRLLALVIDTNSVDLTLGCFAPMKDGRMNNKEEILKWFSFEGMYAAARRTEREKARQTAETEAENEPDNPNYMKLCVRGAKISSIHLSGKTINQINELVYNASEGVIGWFGGHKIQHGLFVEHCLPYSNGDTTGCLVVSQEPVSAVASAYASELNGSMFFMVYRSDDRIDLCVPHSSEEPVQMSMNQMKEWLRRKRN